MGAARETGSKATRRRRLPGRAGGTWPDSCFKKVNAVEGDQMAESSPETPAQGVCRRGGCRGCRGGEGRAWARLGCRSKGALMDSRGVGQRERNRGALLGFCPEQLGRSDAFYLFGE